MRLKKSDKWATGAGITLLVMLVIGLCGCIYGWGSNIYLLVLMFKETDPNIGLMCLRLFGIIFLPAGVVLGYN